MKSYTKIYFKYFDYGEDDFIPCEICGNKSVDIHHIISRSKRKDLLDTIENLMALCRKCHDKYGDKKQYIELLKFKHLNTLL